MPSLRLRFDAFGRPIVRIEGKPGLALQQAFQMHPPNVVPKFDADFLVDTGAAGCFIEDDLIASWRLMKHMPVITKSGMRPKVSGYEYPLSLRLREQGQPDSWYEGSWLVATVPAGHFGGIVKGLIGIDLLQQGSLTYDGPASTCVLAWP